MKGLQVEREEEEEDGGVRSHQGPGPRGQEKQEVTREFIAGE